MNYKQRIKILKSGRRTVFYILIITLITIIITPIYFLFSLSLLSSREAYQFPLPIFPSLQHEFKLEEGEKGYLLSVLMSDELEYETLLDTVDMDKMSRFLKTNLSINIDKEELTQFIERIPVEKVVNFSRKKDLLRNYFTFFKVTRDSVPSLLRSLEIAFFTILISLSIGGLAGYAFARYYFKGKNSLKVGVLFVRVFPAVAIAMPMVIILASMGLYDRPLGLSLVYSVGSIALTIWITTSIFMGIPIELEEAALIFGASRFRAFLNITLPLALPGLAASSMYAFIAAWNETVSALILTQFRPTFSVVIYQSLLGAEGQINLTAAGGVVMAFPAVLFTLFIRKYINQMWGETTVEV